MSYVKLKRSDWPVCTMNANALHRHFFFAALFSSWLFWCAGTIINGWWSTIKCLFLMLKNLVLVFCLYWNKCR